MKNLKYKDKGITLIALVITIIILLILAGISIATLGGNNGLFSRAKEAKNNTLDAQKTENTALNSYNSVIDNITEGSKTVDRTGLKIGDYIDYKADITTSTYSLTSANSGDTNDQTITIDTTLKWRILNINKDGSIDIISDKPASSIVYFNGPIGYNNGVYLMNDICESLYSHGSIKARSINLNDIENQMTEKGKTARDKYDYGTTIYGKTKTYTDNYNDICYPNLYSQEMGAGINTETVTKTGLKTSDKATLDITTPGYKKLAPTSKLTIIQTKYNLGFSFACNSNATSVLTSNDGFWVASRYTHCDSSYAYFGLHYANSGIDGNDMFNSYGNIHYNAHYLRPAVSLGTNVEIEVSPTASTDSSKPHTITKY